MRLSEWIVQCEPDNMLLKTGLHLTSVKLAGPVHLTFAMWGLDFTPRLDTNMVYWFQMSLRPVGRMEEILVQKVLSHLQNCNYPFALFYSAFIQRHFWAVCFFFNLDIHLV